MTLVSPNQRMRRDQLRTADQAGWYQKAGFVVEQNEYVIEPEHYGSGSQRVRSLDFEYEDRTGDSYTLLDVISDTREGEWWPEIEDATPFVRDVSLVVGLTRGEAGTVDWIASGNPMVGEWAVRMGESLGVTRDAARKAWARARIKLVTWWAAEPPVHVRTSHRRWIEGAGAQPWMYPDRPRWGLRDEWLVAFPVIRERAETWKDT